MSSALSTPQVLGSAFQWILLSARGRGHEFYQHDPEGYEAVARLLMGRDEVAQSIRDIVDIAAPRDARVAVDAACGTGLVTDALAGSARSVIGKDLCDGALEFARASKHPSLAFRHGDLQDFSDSEPGSVDVFTMAFAHRYISDLRKFYGDLARSLSPDGIAVISTADMSGTLSRIQQASDDAGLLMKVLRPRFRSLFNRLHGTSHVVLRHA